MNRRQLFARTATLGAGSLVGAGAAGCAPEQPAPAEPAAREQARAEVLPSRADVIAVMNRVDDHWIGTHPDPGDNGWARATYFSGLMHHYRLTREKRLLDYAIGWGEQNGWGLLGGVTTRNADNQCAGQAYLDLYEEVGGAGKIAAIEASLAHLLTDQPDKNDDWWWVDALHMGMPPLVRFGRLRANNQYWVKMYRLYHYCKRQRGIAGVYVQPGNLSESSALWYRDQNFQVDGPLSKSPNGKPVHWSRGNGWVLAAHAKVLEVLPHNDKRGPEYIYTLQQLAAALRQAQQPDGFWYPNLSDPAHFGGPEVSGTAFFVFGLAYGITAGLLDREAHLPVVARAWNAMVATAVDDNGFLGYVQPPGDRPAPVAANHTEDFGVGAFLLAGSEIARLTA
ncbi:glycoside hydrolase family 88/105 protein [Flindersiella endophytica]